jgi:hypothetical protein
VKALRGSNPLSSAAQIPVFSRDFPSVEVA